MNFINRLFLTVRHTIAIWRVLSHPKNRSKGTWRNTPVYQLIDLAKRELEEVEAAIWAYNRGVGSSEHISLECGDVSAFMAMIADVCRDKK